MDGQKRAGREYGGRMEGGCVWAKGVVCRVTVDMGGLEAPVSRDAFIPPSCPPWGFRVYTAVLAMWALTHCGMPGSGALDSGLSGYKRNTHKTAVPVSFS